MYRCLDQPKVIEPTKPQFYNRFVDDIINERCKDRPDIFFQVLNSNHPMIKCTIVVNPDNFVDAKIIQKKMVLP